MDKKCYICDNDFINLIEKIKSENYELYLLLREEDEIWGRWSFEDIEEDLLFDDPIYNKYEGSVVVTIGDRYGIGKKHFDICEICIYTKDGNYHDDFFKVKEFEEGLFSKKQVMTIDVENIKKNKEKWKKRIETEWQEAIKLHSDKIEIAKKKKEKLENDIVDLLKEKAIKMPVSDINALLKYGDIDAIKKTCEEMYENGKIDFAGNGRYYIQTAQEEKKKKSTSNKSEPVDVKSELKKYNEMLDEGLITQEEYDTKRKQILGL